MEDKVLEALVRIIFSVSAQITISNFATELIQTSLTQSEPFLLDDTLYEEGYIAELLCLIA